MTLQHLGSESAVAHAYGLTHGTCEAAEIELHLSQCDDCSRRIRALRKDREALGASLCEDPPVRVAPHPKGGIGRRPWAQALAAALCLAAVGFGLFPSWEARQPASQGEPGIAQDLRDLAAEDAQTRERAFDRLLELRESVLPQLRKALEETQDPEVKARLEELIRTPNRVRLEGLVCGQPDGAIEFASSRGWLLRRFETAFPGPAFALAPSPDGKRLAYRVGVDPDTSSLLVVMDLASGRGHLVSHDATSGAVWAPDSRSLYVASPRGLEQVLVEDGARGTLLPDGVPCFFTADRLRLVVWRKDRLEAVDPSSGRSEALTQASGIAAAYEQGRLCTFFGAPDGRVSYDTPTFPVIRFDLGTRSGRVVVAGATVPVPPPVKRFPGWPANQAQGFDRKWGTFEAPASSPGERFFAWVRVGPDGSRQVSVARADGSSERVLGPGRSPAWSPRGLLLAYETADGQTRVVDMETGQERSRPGGAPAWIRNQAR